MGKMRTKRSVIVVILSILLMVGMMWAAERMIPMPGSADDGQEISAVLEGFSYGEIPQFDGSSPYVSVNGNIPFFPTEGLTDRAYESYGRLDKMGRCTVVSANIGRELMPTEDRESISSVKPSGWHSVRYDCVDEESLYNRCHLIGFQLTGENANERNLITGTRYLNTEGMLPFENMVADYIKETGNHVMYRVTPVFIGKELVARGVIMEGYSVEDKGEGICFNVYCYNNQPEIEIDYATGDSRYVGKAEGTEQAEKKGRYILNTSSMKFHLPDCPSVKDIASSNKKTYNGSRDGLIKDGYSPCGACRP